MTILEKTQVDTGQSSAAADRYRAWPDKSCRYWWMRYQRTPRSKVAVMLVELTEHEGMEYVKPWQDSNCYPRSFVNEWSARFKRCDSTPEFEGV